MSGPACKESRPAVWQLTVWSYSDGLSVVYQMTGTEVRHSASGAVSPSLPLSPQPVWAASYLEHMHPSATELWLAHQPQTVTVSPDRLITRLPASSQAPPPPNKNAGLLVKEWDGAEERDVVVV